jgi:hypothetical protein
MHQTTVRFGPDVWEALEIECRSLGVSAAQYLREAAVARLAYTAGRAGSPRYETALAAAGAKPVTVAQPPADTPKRMIRHAAPAAVAARTAGAVAEDQRSSSTALKAQSEIVLARSRGLRERSERIRGGNPLRKA